MNSSKVNIAISKIVGKILSIVGYASLFLGVFGLIFELTYEDGVDSAGLILGVFFVVIGAFCVFKGHQIKRRIVRFRKYVALISIQKMFSINDIASATMQNPAFVINDLQTMINKRFFVNAIINRATGEIQIAGLQAKQSEETAHIQLEAFTCHGCAATGAKPVGGNTTCDYCGSYIK